MTTQLAALFNEEQKWQSFIELYGKKEDIARYWREQFREEMKRRVNTDGDAQWRIRVWRPFSYGWYLQKDGQESLMILFEDNNLCLWINENRFDVQRIQEYRNTPLFSFFQPHEILFAGSYIAKRPQYLSVNNSTDIDYLSWFMGNQNEELLEKLYRDVKELMKEANTFSAINASAKK